MKFILNSLFFLINNMIAESFKSSKINIKITLNFREPQFSGQTSSFLKHRSSIFITWDIPGLFCIKYTYR